MADNPTPEPASAADATGVARAEELMAHIARPAIGRMLLISVVIHIALLLLTSVRFISLCFEHHTLHPSVVLKQIEQDKREKELEAKREAARQRILAAKKQKEAGTKAPGTATKAGTAPSTGDQTSTKPKVIQDIEAKSNERPAKSDVSLDGMDELE